MLNLLNKTPIGRPGGTPPGMTPLGLKRLGQQFGSAICSLSRIPHSTMLRYFDEEAESVGEKMLMAEAVNIQAGSFFVKGEISNAIPFAERYVELYELNWPNTHNHATALINMGSMYSSTGKNVKAIQCFKQSLKLAEEHMKADFNFSMLCQIDLKS